ncbi:hypothetical protein B7486_42420 [cyanobacterium TDX16]|nr:hypothetical protein B7486_42420 [cyanobacterium TDX16]
MLRVQNTSSQKAIRYFRQKPEQKKGYRCLGAGARELGIEAEIEAKEFENLMQGLSPDGSQHLSSRAIAPEKRRAVLECLFCAPKSVSIQALPGGDKQLLEAQMRAVELVVGQIEQEYIGARITIDGERSFVKTGNLIAIAIDHPESRSLDPHVHTHCLIVNATQSPTNGKWYALSNEQILADQQYLGLQYRHHLALEVQKLGYEIQLQAGGQFEIVGYSRPQLLASSQRQQKTLELAPDNPTWEQRNTARLLTRSSKQHICEEELVRNQRARLQELEISFVTPGQPHPDLKGTPLTPQILEEAISHCSEYQVAFRRQDLEKYILSEYLTCDLSGLNDSIEQNTELIRTPETNRVRYTTRDALARERATIRLMQEGQGAVKALTSTEAIATQLGQTDLNSGQQQAVQLAATTTDRFIAWQGVAGAGKTYALKEVLKLLKEQGYDCTALAPSAQAAKVVGDELGIEGQTVDLLLASNRLPKDSTPQYWIVDEAGLIGAKNGFKLLQKATEDGARILFVGDSKQLSAVQAGNPFKSLQVAGIQTAYLNESRRQRHNPELKAAVDTIAVGKVVEGFKQLEKSECIQTVAASEKVEAIVKDYMRCDRASRVETLVLAGTHVERLAIASSLRAALKAEGSLSKEDVSITQLKAKNLSPVQLNKLNHFVRGDFIVPLRDYKRRGLKKGEVYEIAGVGLDRVNLKSSNGEILAVDPDFKKSLYQAQQVGIAVGDRLRWTRNDRALGRRNGQEFTVEAIEDSVATIAYKDGKREALDLNRAQHLDYALVSTIYSSQGKTARRVLVSCDRTINQESFYVAVSRPTHELKLYTDNPQELLELASRSRSKETVEEALSPAPINVTPLAQIKRNCARGIRALVKIAPTHVPPPIKRLPLPKEPFWSPSVPLSPPAGLEASAWQELVANSVIHPAIAQLNFRSLKEDSIEKTHEAWEYLFYSAKLDRTNTGQLVSGILKRYGHIENGGWWCGAGVDPLSFSNLKPGEKPDEKLWGCFKPNTPRVDRDKLGKVIKYEHPLKTQRSIFLLHVPDSIAKRIYQKEQINPSPDDRERGFWYCAWKYNLPITITEGAKKAACLLSQGHAAIGLPGIYAGYSSKDERGYPIPPRLHEELAVFATPDRQVTFCFDYETKPKTIRNINIAIARTATLLQRQGCTVSKVVLPGLEKGVDDFILARGPLFYERQYRTAKTLPILSDNLSQGGDRERNNTAIVGGIRTVVEDTIAPAPAGNRKRESQPDRKLQGNLSRDRVEQADFGIAASEHKTDRDLARRLAAGIARSFKAEETTERIAGAIAKIQRELRDIHARDPRSQSQLQRLSAEIEQFSSEVERVRRKAQTRTDSGKQLSVEIAKTTVNRVEREVFEPSEELVTALQKLSARLKSQTLPDANLERETELCCSRLDEFTRSLRGWVDESISIAATSPSFASDPRIGETVDVAKQQLAVDLADALAADIEQTILMESVQLVTTLKHLEFELNAQTLPELEIHRSIESCCQRLDELSRSLGTANHKLSKGTNTAARSEECSVDRSNLAERLAETIDRVHEDLQVEQIAGNIAATNQELLELQLVHLELQECFQQLSNGLEKLQVQLAFEPQANSATQMKRAPIESRQAISTNAPKLADTPNQLQVKASSSTSNSGFAESSPKQGQRSLVKINTTNPLLEQYNGKIGEVLQQIKFGRMEQTIVKIGNVTPTFSASDLEPVPAGSKSSERQSQNALPAQSSAPAQLQSTSNPISQNPHHELIASQQPPTTHSTDIGKRTSKIFHSHSHPAPSAPSTSRTNRNKSASTSHSVEAGSGASGTRTTEFAKHHERTAKDRQAKAHRNSPVPGTAASDRFGAIDTSIERRERLRSLVNLIRTIPLEAVAPYLGLEYDPATKTWNGGGCAIGIDGKEFVDRLADKKGRGAVSFVAHIRGTSLKESLTWLSDSLAAIQSHSLQSEATVKQIGKSTEEIDRSVDYAIVRSDSTHPGPLSKQASENQRETPQDVTAAELQQLSDRELLDLDRAVKSYFDRQPTRSPTDQIRLLQSDIDTLKEQLGQLWQQQARQVSTIELLQKQPFHHLNPKYHKAFLEMQNVTEEINRVVELKQRKESLVEIWNKREMLYQAWEISPKTSQMKDLEKALSASEIQERIEQELERQKQWQRHDRKRGINL